jgi:YYY domain-containing protein
MLLSIITWYLVLQFMAIVALPLAFATLRRLPSRGYATAKALGVLLTGVVFWWGGILHLWPNTAGAVLLAAGIVLVVGLVLMRRCWHEVLPWWRRRRRHVFVTEVLFLIALVIWALVRATQPQLETAGGEKWMEIAFLNASLRAPFLPPHDPWLSGFAISYYYLGYLLLSILTRLTVIPSTIAFNLGNAGWYALVAVQAYALVYDMTRGRGLYRALVGPLLLLVTGNGEGMLEVLHARGLLPAQFWRWLGIRNLTEPPEPPFSWIPQRFFWWWQASRTLQDKTPWGDHQEVIDEFPAFSFLLGDMHPHLLALPFVLVAITLALNAYRRAAFERDPSPEPDKEPAIEASIWISLKETLRLSRLAPLAGYALVLGALGFLNTWDFPIYWALMVGAWTLGRYLHADRSVAALFRSLWSTVPEAFVLGLLSVGLYAPFWLGLRSQAGGILPNLFNATRLPHFLIMFLPLLVPVIGLIGGALRRRRVKWSIALGASLGLGIGLIVVIAILALLVGSAAAYPYLRMILRGESVQGYTLAPDVALAAFLRRLANPWTALLLAVATSATLLSIIRGHGGPGRDAVAERRERRSHRSVDGTSDGDEMVLIDFFPLLLALLGLLLTLAPEFVYLQDVFVTRMNTIFKFYFQAWVLWSLAGAWQVARWIEPRRLFGEDGGGALLGAALSALFIGVGLVYTLLAVPARAQEHGVPWTLDGAAWLGEARPADYDAIRWLNANIDGAPVIVEAPGDQHKAYVYEGRVSALTGLPTVLGWGGHQRQWRGNYDEPARREVDLEQLFTTPDYQEARVILRRYDVAYVYIGPVERQRYPAAGLEKFEEMLPVVYQQGDVTVYEVIGSDLSDPTVP